MHETPEELSRLQRILDASAAGAGPHLRAILTEDRRVDAASLCQELSGMRLLVVATVTADGRPLAGPVDGYFLHGSFSFSSGRNSVRMRHLASPTGGQRDAISPETTFAVTVHGRAELFDVLDPAHGDLRQAMLDFYLPKQGPAFETWLRHENPIGARIAPEKVFTFQMGQ